MYLRELTCSVDLDLGHLYLTPILLLLNSLHINRFSLSEMPCKAMYLPMNWNHQGPIISSNHLQQIVPRRQSVIPWNFWQIGVLESQFKVQLICYSTMHMCLKQFRLKRTLPVMHWTQIIPFGTISLQQNSIGQEFQLNLYERKIGENFICLWGKIGDREINWKRNNKTFIDRTGWI